MNTEWLWIPGYLATIWLVFGVVKCFKPYVKDEHVLIPMFWPFVIIFGLGAGAFWAASGCGALAAKAACGVPGAVVRGYKWARRNRKPRESAKPTDAGEYRSRPCPECGK